MLSKFKDSLALVLPTLVFVMVPIFVMAQASVLMYLNRAIQYVAPLLMDVTQQSTVQVILEDVLSTYTNHRPPLVLVFQTGVLVTVLIPAMAKARVLTTTNPLQLFVVLQLVIAMFQNLALVLVVLVRQIYLKVSAQLVPVRIKMGLVMDKIHATEKEYVLIIICQAQLFVELLPVLVTLLKHVLELPVFAQLTSIKLKVFHVSDARKMALVTEMMNVMEVVNASINSNHPRRFVVLQPLHVM